MFVLKLSGIQDYYIFKQYLCLIMFYIKEVSICNLGPDFDLDGKVDNHNAIKLIYGEVETNSNSIHIYIIF